jgi:peptidyl-prolyl cis-trans isomerase B (cyclophilin B)
LELLARIWMLEQETTRSRVQIAILDAAIEAGADPAVRALLELGLGSPRYEVRVRAIEFLDRLFDEDRSAEAGPASELPLEEYERILEWAAQPRAVLVTMERPGFQRDAFTLRLDTESAPLTAWNFARLADEGFYNGLRIHRLVPNFLVQGGDPSGDGSGGPGYAIRDETGASTFAPGTLGMASSGRDLAGSQYFITLMPQPQLNGRYTAFGQVVQNFPGVVARLLPGDRVVSVMVYAGDGTERIPAPDQL